MTFRSGGEGHFSKEQECCADKAGVCIPLTLSGDWAEQWADKQETVVSLKTTQWFKESMWKTQSPQRPGDENNCVIEEKLLSLTTMLCSGCSFNLVSVEQSS